MRDRDEVPPKGLLRRASLRRLVVVLVVLVVLEVEDVAWWWCWLWLLVLVFPEDEDNTEVGFHACLPVFKELVEER